MSRLTSLAGVPSPQIDPSRWTVVWYGFPPGSPFGRSSIMPMVAYFDDAASAEAERAQHPGARTIPPEGPP